MVGSKAHHHTPSLVPEELKLLRYVMRLQVQHVTGMPPAAEGHGMVVGWRSKAGEGEHTALARVSRAGEAAFDEVFMHYFTAGRATLRIFTVWAALIDDDSARSGGGRDLGAFPVDLPADAAAESSHPRFGGKALSFPLDGAAAGAVLTVSVNCRVMEQEEVHGASGPARERKNKGKSSYASCLPDLSCLRNRPPAGAAQRAKSLHSDWGGFITIENSAAEMDGANTSVFGRVEDDEEGAGFITMEGGAISSRSWRVALALESRDDEEDEKACLVMELSSGEVEEVEDEFLAMLEDKYWADMARSKEIEKGLSVTLDEGLDRGLDMDSLIRNAEMELTRAEQAWKSKVGASIIEEEEYKELVRRWGGTTTREEHLTPSNSGTSCSWGFGFGSPI